MGLHPCPRCLIPKSKLDETGMKCDIKFWLENVCTYLFDYVQIARNTIYKLGAAITGEAVNQLLKATSSVPTMVCQDPFTAVCKTLGTFAKSTLCALVYTNNRFWVARSGVGTATT
jgi:hypothetical protein